MTVIQKAKELVAELGKQKAIKYFKDRIVEPNCFQDICNNAGNNTAIDFINKNY